MNKRGFTLVELLVVVGIISLLIAILLPSLGRAREQARSIVCQSNLRQWGIGFMLYANDSKGVMPFDGNDGDVAGSPVSERGWDDPALWINAIPPRVGLRKTYDQMQIDHANGVARLPIFGERTIFTCPSATDASPGVLNATTETYSTGSNAGYFKTWGLTAPIAAGGIAVDRPTFICYAYNAKVNGLAPKALRFTMLKPSSEVALIVEKRMRGNEISAEENAFYVDQGGQANRLWGASGRNLQRIKADWQRLAKRHNGGGYVLFADGHVGHVALRDALTSTKDASGANVNDWNQPGKIIWSIGKAATK